MKKLKIVVFVLIITLLLCMPVSAKDYYKDIPTEVSGLVSQGILPSFHNDVSKSEGYQTFYTKKVKMNNREEGLKHLAKMTYGELHQTINWYNNEWNQLWYDVINNLDIEPGCLEPNKVLGLYWDSRIDESYSYLYLIWTTEYIPAEFMTIHNINVNGINYTQYDDNAKSIVDGKWIYSNYYHYSEENITIHKTAIAGYDNGKKFGIPLTQKYKIKGPFNVGIDKHQFLKDPDPSNEYERIIDADITFDLGSVPKKDGKKVCQLVTHAYELIKDCEVQSYWDNGFGGYRHLVHFNTTIDIDKIYRVDVSYTLTSDNKKWYEFWADTEEVDVKKSLTTEKVKSGIFNLFSYQGFKEGTFKSNENNSKTYQYELHLNYSENGWNIFSSEPYYEYNYKRIKDFQILRLNYCINGKIYDVKVKMDTVDGETKSIVDRDLILDTESVTYKTKDKIFGLIDGVKNVIGKAKSFFITVISIIGGLILICVVYKLGKAIYDVFKERRE